MIVVVLCSLCLLLPFGRFVPLRACNAHLWEHSRTVTRLMWWHCCRWHPGSSTFLMIPVKAVGWGVVPPTAYLPEGQGREALPRTAEPLRWKRGTQRGSKLPHDEWICSVNGWISSRPHELLNCWQGNGKWEGDRVRRGGERRGASELWLCLLKRNLTPGGMTLVVLNQAGTGRGRKHGLITERVLRVASQQNLPCAYWHYFEIRRLIISSISDVLGCQRWAFF